MFRFFNDSKFILACAICACNISHVRADASRPPDIIVLMLDDLDQKVSSPYFPDALKNIYQLKKEGLYFENAFVPTSICCPSRASFLTGKYGHNTGVLTNGGTLGGYGAFKDDERYSLPNYLQKLGYYTIFTGKYLNGFHASGVGEKKLPPIPYGWNSGSLFVDKLLKSYTGYDYQLMNFRDGHEQRDDSSQQVQWAGQADLETFGKKESDYSSDVIFNKALGNLAYAHQNHQDKPIFALITPTCPHYPLPPAKRHYQVASKLWGSDSFPKNRPNYYSDVMDKDFDIPQDIPSWLRDTWKKRQTLKDYFGLVWWFAGSDLPAPLKFPAGFNEVEWFNRMGSLMACDEGAQKVVDWLKVNQRWDNTVFIVTSDNGYNLGAHSLVHKMAPYEESIRVPLLIASGKDLPFRKNETDSNWILNIDFAPTILDLLGSLQQTLHQGANDPKIFFDGESFLPHLYNRQANPLRSAFLLQYHGGLAGDGILAEMPQLSMRWLPAFVLDLPSYKGVRFQSDLNLPGMDLQDEFLFVEWEKVKEAKLDPSQKTYEYELFNISKDPYQLRNLVYYEPSHYTPLLSRAKGLLATLQTCQGAACNLTKQ